MSYRFYSVLLVALLGPFAVPRPASAANAKADAAAETVLDEVVVTAVLRPVSGSQLPQSITQLSESTLRASGLEHFGDVLGLIPNLAAAGGTTRPRYFQLRGVGEQEQYQGAPNPSVGFLIDGIDFSGVGMPATLFDLQSIDVLRGPQGSAYGANALGGLISLQTRAPTEGFDVRGEADAGNYRTRSAALALGNGNGNGSTALGWRLAAQQFRSDGFRDNAFLKRSDTNGFNESTVRGRLHWQAESGLRAELSVLQANIDNGYDAWTIDNTRTTQSDKPGRDAQRSSGGSLRLHLDAPAFGSLESISSAADSRIVFSFDGDWGNDPFWARQPACRANPSFCVPYDFTSATTRVRRTVAEDLRLVGDDAHRLFDRVRWLVGVYALRLTESNTQLDLYNGAPYTVLGSRYRANNTALYGQLDTSLAQRLELSFGLRGEQRQATYNDTQRSAFSPTDRMWGGNLSLQFQRTPFDQHYLTLARGFKAGGFNIGTSIPVARRQYRPEYLWNLEAGRKKLSPLGTWQWQANVFYMRRVNQQVSSSVQSDPTDPLTYQFYTDNAARGDNYGLEASGKWRLAPRWQLGGSLGLLATRYLDFAYNVTTYDAASNPKVVRRVLSGRAQEYAPPLQASLSMDYESLLPFASVVRWQAHLDATHSAGYYFSASHDQRAQARSLVNARLSLLNGDWDVSLWARNLFAARSALHGFYFGNEPPDYPNRLYLQQGEPRQIGLRVAYSRNAR
jgi:outer membrane receptor protein involved in Fe transport